MSIPGFASAARFPSAENTVDNLFQALLPHPLSTATTSESESECKPVASTSSRGLMLATGDDDRMHSSGCSSSSSSSRSDDDIDDPSSDEGARIWNSEDASSSSVDSEEEMDTLSHLETRTVLPLLLRRRSSVIPVSNQELVWGLQATFDSSPEVADSATSHNSEASEKGVKVPSHHEILPVPPSEMRRRGSVIQISNKEAIWSLQSTFDHCPEVADSVASHNSEASEESEEGMTAPSHHENLQVPPSGMRRRSSVVQISNKEAVRGLQVSLDSRPEADVSTTSHDSESFEEGMHAPSHHENLPVPPSGVRRRSSVIQISSQHSVRCSFPEVEEVEDSATCQDSQASEQGMNAPSHHENLPVSPSGVRRRSSVTQILSQDDVWGLQASLDCLPAEVEEVEDPSTRQDSRASEQELNAPSHHESLTVPPSEVQRISSVQANFEHLLEIEGSPTCQDSQASEQGTNVPSHHDNLPVPPWGVRRRSSVVQTSNQKVGGVQVSLDSSLPEVEDSATCQDSEVREQGMNAPYLPVPPSGMRRHSNVKQMSSQEVGGLKAGLDSPPDFDFSAARHDSEASQDLAYVQLLQPDDFVKFLEKHHVPVKSYGRGKARCLQDLWAEVVIRECSLKRVPDPLGSSKRFLQRSVRVLVLEVKATIEGREKFLLLKREANDYGHTRERLDACTTVKMFDDEDIPSAMHRCLLQNLGLECSSLEDKFAIESEEDVKEVHESTAYPGLRTIYTMRVVHMRVRDIFLPKMAAIGLPSGSNFTTEMMVSALGVGKTLTWCWCMDTIMKAAKRAKQRRQACLSDP